MIAFIYTFLVILITLLFNVQYYFSFLLLVLGLLIYRNILGLKSRIFGYVFLFRKRIKRQDLLNYFSALLFIIFYFNREIRNLSLDTGIGISTFYIVLYYWLFHDLPLK